MSFVLDTDVISQFTKATPHIRAMKWLGEVDELSLYLSVATLIELRSGMVMLPPGKRRASLLRWLGGEVVERFAHRLLPVSQEVAAECGSLIGGCRSRGVNVDPFDALIAATARVSGYSVVTLNTKHFRHFSVPLVRL